MERSPNIITAAISSKTTRTLQLKLSDLHNNLLTFLMPCLFNILMPFMSDVIKKELTSCKLSLWGQMERLMDMEPTCLTSTLMTLIQTILQKSTLQLLEMDRSGSILIFTVVEKFVSVSQEHGEEVQWKIGILKFQLFYRFLSQFNPSSCLKKFTLTNPVSNMSKEQSKVRRKTKLMPTSSDMETSNLPCSKTSKIHLKDSRMSLKGTFI